jgi:hypothetical protein
MSSILARVLPTMRSLDPILASLAVSAASIEPLDPNRLPGRRSHSGRKCLLARRRLQACAEFEAQGRQFSIGRCLLCVAAISQATSR